MVDRYKLEEAIYQSDMSNDLEIAFERYCDGPFMSEDEGANMLMALWQISKLRHWKLEDTFCREFKLDHYCDDPEVLALRDKIEKSKLKENVE